MENKPKIRIVDNQFSHCGNGIGSYGTGDLGLLPTKFQWHRGDRIGDIVVVTENSFDQVSSLSEPIKVAMIIEPECINSESYNWIRKNYDKFTHVLTYNLRLISEIPNATFYFFGGSWIYPQDRAVHQKSKSVSIVASAKRMSYGHNLRHDVIEKYGSRLDGIFGRGYKFVDNKIEALKDFRYSVVIENEQSDIWITEKLLDCLATGTIPIFWGTSAIRDYFDEDGILFFNTLDEFEKCLDLATPEYYQSKLHSVAKNFELCQRFLLPEDIMWDTFFKSFVQ